MRSDEGSGAEIPDSGGAPWLSVLVPVYNVVPFVGECLTSILDQIAGDAGIELIAVDDCSTDGSNLLCDRLLAASGLDARLIRQPTNGGVSAARNALIDAARGDYLWFVDSDDCMLPGAIAALKPLLAASPDAVLCDYTKGGARTATFDGPKGVLCHDTEALIAGTFATRQLHVWSRIWKREVFGADTRFPQGACFEDVATVPWLMLRVRSYIYAGEPWIFYRSRSGSIMARVNARHGDFDTRGNDDLAKALTGFAQALVTQLPQAAEPTRAAVARFLAREFVKITKRRLRARSKRDWAEVRCEIARYREAMEGCSPIPFAAVARGYIRQGKVDRAFMLTASLLLGRGR